MKIDLHDGMFELRPSQLLRLRGAAGTRIRCESGVLWVTQEGRLRDDFLCAGQSLLLVSNGMTVVEAVGELEARIRLQAPVGPEQYTSALQPRPA
ncbi:MAG TPA: DUF2917 domain-containing protein [Burkholderiales bacterium]|nr:DUF2917 domain-containing protein [Burkholderiales bacterium]